MTSCSIYLAHADDTTSRTVWTMSKRVFMVGATGTIGRATVRALLDHGHEVTCFVRPSRTGKHRLPSGAIVRSGDVTDPASIVRDGFGGERFDAVVSCMASRTGAPKDAWAIDHRAHMHLLAAAQQANVQQFVLLSAICVQKPRLAFQHAKLAFEETLMESGLAWSIVRPTAYFKSVSGQVARVMQGRPFLVFGDGQLTSCKPISDRDLGEYLATCMTDASCANRILPIGGPGDAITPLQQAEHLFALLDRAPQIRKVPVAMIRTIAGSLDALGRVIPPLAAKAELARIGEYYATESMLVWDAERQRYDADATPSTGSDTLFDYYAQLVRGESVVERGEHAVF